MTRGNRAIDESYPRFRSTAGYLHVRSESYQVERIKSVLGSEGFESSRRKLTRGYDVVERTQGVSPLTEVTDYFKTNLRNGTRELKRMGVRTPESTNT
jgi:hypothetical protein